MLCRAFNWQPGDADAWMAHVHRDRCLALFSGPDVVAFSHLRPFAQFFGGRAVPMGGYSPIGVAAEHRGRGHATAVTVAHFPAMRDRGEPIAALYPASTRLYRRAGFELAGVRSTRTLSARTLQLLPVPSEIAVRAGTEEDLPAVRACYRRIAPDHDGWLDRPDVWWERLLGERFDQHHLYVVDGEAGDLLGYVRYDHLPPEGREWGYTIAVAEVVTARAEVEAALWRLVGSSSTLVETVHAVGPPEHPLLLALPEQDLRTRGELRWMLRVVDARAAVGARGFPPAVEVGVDLELEDHDCPWNAGRWRLSIEGGVGRLDPGGRGTVRLGPRGLAALWSGYAPPATLAQAGLLDGGTPADLAGLRAGFAGPTPWMPDFF